jgi:hypothetical protein
MQFVAICSSSVYEMCEFRASSKINTWQINWRNRPIPANDKDDFKE